MASEEFIFNITINKEEKIIYIYERINLNEIIKILKAIDPDNIDSYRLSSYEFEEQIGGIVPDDNDNNDDDDIDGDAAREIIMKLSQAYNIDHT